MGNAPDALLLLTSLLMQDQVRPDGDGAAAQTATPEREQVDIRDYAWHSMTDEDQRQEYEVHTHHD